MPDNVIWENKDNKVEGQKEIKQERVSIKENADKLQDEILAGLGVVPPKPRKKNQMNQNHEQPKSKKEKMTKGKYFEIFGSLLILISLVGLVYTIYPIAKAEIFYRMSKLLGSRFTLGQTEIQPQKTTFGDLLGRRAPTILVPKSTEFGIVVEKIGANAPIIANVNAANSREYNAKLQKGVAHAAGTKLPGETGVSFLFAHSVLNPWDVPRYNAVFYLLRELTSGDRIVIFWQGRRYDYIVYDKKIVGPNDVQFLYQTYSQNILVLQTCDPPGTTWRRLLIFAKLASGTNVN